MRHDYSVYHAQVDNYLVHILLVIACCVVSGRLLGLDLPITMYQTVYSLQGSEVFCLGMRSSACADLQSGAWMEYSYVERHVQTPNISPVRALYSRRKSVPDCWQTEIRLLRSQQEQLFRSLGSSTPCVFMKRD